MRQSRIHDQDVELSDEELTQIEDEIVEFREGKDRYASAASFAWVDRGQTTTTVRLPLVPYEELPGDEFPAVGESLRRCENCVYSLRSCSMTSGGALKLLLTSGGIRNASIRNALVELLDKPIAESNALFVPTALYSFPGGAEMAWKAISGNSSSPLCDLGWRSVGVLELTALPTIKRENWVPKLHEADALLVFGGDVLYLRYWMQASGLADLLPTLNRTVYVGLSGGSIVVTPYNCDADFNLQFVPEGSEMANDAGAGLGFVDFALRVHLDREGEAFEDSTLAEVEKWAANIPAPTYAIDDESAIKVTEETVEVVSEGNWKLLTPNTNLA